MSSSRWLLSTAPEVQAWVGRSVDDLATVLTVASASSDPLPDRARAMLAALRRAVPFDSAWLALADPLDTSYRSLAFIDLDAPVVRYLEGPSMARGVEVTRTGTTRAPLSPAKLPFPAGELSLSAVHLHPADIHEVRAGGLCTADVRHVGFLALLFADERAPAPVERLATAVPVLARATDPMQSLLTVMRLVRGATAGVVLREDGRTGPIQGWPTDPLLTQGSASLAAAAVRLRRGRICSTFLWPRSHGGVVRGYDRITALAAPGDLPSVQGVVAVSPACELRGLTPRELEVLGFVVDGCSNREIAQALTVTERTVAAHVEHVLAKLDVPTRTLAAVRVEGEGLYVPATRTTYSPVP